MHSFSILHVQRYLSISRRLVGPFSVGNAPSRTVHKSGVLPVQACRRPQSFLRKSNGDVICRDGINTETNGDVIKRVDDHSRFYARTKETARRSARLSGDALNNSLWLKSSARVEAAYIPYVYTLFGES